MQSVLIIFAANDDIQQRYINACIKRDIRPIFVIPRQSLSSFKMQPLIEYIIIEKLHNQDQNLLEYAKKLPGLAGIIPGSELAFICAEFLAANLGLPYSVLTDPSIFRNKYRMRRLFCENKVDQPELIGVAADGQHLDRLLDLIEAWPIVTKPVDMAGSWYVFLNYNKKEVEAHANEIFNDKVSFLTGLSFAGECILEKYFGGIEYSAEVVIEKSKIYAVFITRKFTSSPPLFDEIGHLSGVVLPSELYNCLCQNISKIVHGASIASAIMHIEFKIDNEKIAIIEAACRIAGGRISTLVELQYGVSLEELMVMLKVGLDLPPLAIKEQTGFFYGVRFQYHDITPVRLVTDGIFVHYDEDNAHKFVNLSKTHMSNRIGSDIFLSRSESDFQRYLAKDSGNSSEKK